LVWCCSSLASSRWWRASVALLSVWKEFISGVEASTAKMSRKDAK
jgi:hypothetical protein